MRERSASASLRLLLLFVVVLLCAATATAQLAGKGSIAGTVADTTGAVVPGASVTAVNIATNVRFERTASESGTYTISLDAGRYSVTVEAKGFKTTTQTNVNVNALETMVVNFALTVGSTTEKVEVTDAVPQLDTATAQITATMEQEMYSELPVPQLGTQRRATDFVALMPGVNAQPSNGGLDTNTGVVNGSGSRGAVASVYIQGVPIMSVAGQGDPRFIWTAIPVEAINQFQVTTVGYPATYEGQGVLNYDVKRGTNNIHGSAYEFLRNTALDTWGYMGSTYKDPITGKPRKLAEHQNEYGVTAGAPIIKDKLFVFGAFEGYKLRSAPNLQWQTNPTAKMMAGDFSEFPGRIFDPATTRCEDTACTRYVRDAFANNIIPTARLNPQALYMQKLLPPLTNSNLSGNYLGGQPTGRNNWMTTERVDWVINQKQNLSGVLALGKQSTLGGPGTGGGGYTGTISNTNNQAPAPFGSSQDFQVGTRVVILEHTYVVSSHVVNQIKLAYGRYSSTGTSRSIGDGWGAAAAGIAGLPAGQATDSFPTVTFSGNGNGINRWAGYSSNRNTANGYIVTDNVQWEKGKHSITIGGQMAWMQYNFLNNTTGVNPLQLTFNSQETADYKLDSKTGKRTSYDTATGNAYASFLLGAVNNGNYTVSAAPETGARFRAISPYVQDNWKVNSKLTLNLGLRWDMYPSYREAQDRISWMDPTVINPLVNYPGALVFGGDGTGLCNCRTNVKDYYKNFGPRLGFAYQMFSKTVLRGSWGVMYTHGNNVGGSATSRQGPGLLGYAWNPRSPVAPNPTSITATPTGVWYLNQPFTATVPALPNFDPTMGTTFNTNNSTAVAQTVNYADPYYGGRAPQYINWSFGIQHQLNNSTTATLTYVGSQGHFTYMDATTARGIYSNQLDPKWLYLGSNLSSSVTAANLSTLGLTAPYPSIVGSSANISQMLRPFPQYNGVSDILGYVGNTNYNALEAILQRRMTNGLTFMATYTWSKSIDNSGTFRSGYDIPAAYAQDGVDHKARSLDRSLSLSDIPQRFVATSVYALPFGKGKLGGENAIVKALAGNWQISNIFQIQAGAPLGLVYQNCPTNQSAQTCQPFLNPNFNGNIYALGGYTHVPADQLAKTSYLNYYGFIPSGSAPTYMFSTLARTAPMNLRNSGNYQWDMSLKRTFPLTERFKLKFQADAYNLTNHTRIGFANNAAIINVPKDTSTAFGAAGVMNNSRYLQLALRLDF